MNCPTCALFLTRAPYLLDSDGLLDTQSLEEYCRQSELRAAKLDYLHSLEDLEPLLKLTNVDVRLVHYVQDPRATVLSLFRTEDLQRNATTFRYYYY